MHAVANGNAEATLKWETVAGSWPGFADLIRRRWPELSDMQWQSVDGRRALLVDYLQETYCLSRDSAEQEVDDWIDGFGDALDVDTGYQDRPTDAMAYAITHSGEPVRAHN